MAEITDTFAELPTQLAYWQKALRLQDWRIEANFCHGYEIDGNLGSCNIHYKKKTASIQITVPEDRDPTAVGGAEPWQVTLIHELLHILMDGIGDREESSSVAEEQAIAILSNLLWEMRESA